MAHKAQRALLVYIKGDAKFVCCCLQSQQFIVGLSSPQGVLHAMAQMAELIKGAEKFVCATNQNGSLWDPPLLFQSEHRPLLLLLL